MDPSTRTPGRSAAIDGLRGLALAGMMAWHAEIGWVRGGFARMTIFFVLAGYLSTRTVRRLSSTPGTTPWRAFGSFWARRVRRLLPLTLLGVALAVWTTAHYGGSTANGRLFGDTVSVLTSWSNWRFVAEQRSYGAFFESPSAFQHFWSLSVEEQCFLVLPIAVFGATVIAARVAKRAAEPLRTAAVLGALGVIGCAVPAVVAQGPDTVYYGTHVRLGEFLVGAAFAVFWERTGPTLSRRAARWWSAAGAVGVVGLVVIMLTVGREHAFIYRGGMGLVVIPVVAVFGGILSGGRIVNTVLGIAPLRWLGRGALSIYALHWPIYQIVQAHLPGRTHWLVVLVEVAISLAVGTVVFVGIERPLLPGSTGRIAPIWAKARVAFPTLGVAVAACVLWAAAVPPVEPPIRFEALAKNPAATATMSIDEAHAALADEEANAPLADDEANAVLADAEANAVLADAEAAKPGLPVMRDRGRIGIGLFGGSTALTLALGYDRWEPTAPWAQVVPGYAPLGCGLLDRGERAHADPGNELPEGPVPPTCASRGLRWAATAKVYDIAVPVIVASTAELTTWRLPGDDRWRALGDPALDAAVATALRDSVDELLAAGAQHVVLTTAVSPSPDMDPDAAATRRRRVARYRELLDELAAVRDVTIVDLTSWSDSLNRNERRRLLPDGIHVSTEGGIRAWSERLGPAIDDLYRRGVIVRPA